MAINPNLASLIANAPANKIVDQNLINARNIFGIDDEFLLKDYNNYYMDKPPSLDRNEGIVSLPVNTNVVNQGGGGGEGQSIFDIKNKISTGTKTPTNSGGITDLQKQLSEGVGYNNFMNSIKDDYNEFSKLSPDFVSFEDYFQVKEPFGKNPITGVAYKQPRTIADQNKILGYTFSDPSKFTGISSLRDFLPGGKYSLTGMVMGGFKGINNAIQGTNFAKATSLADYRDMMSYGGYEEREAAREKAKAEAKAAQARIDAAEKKRKDAIKAQDATAEAKKAAKEGRAYDYSGRKNQYGTHTSTISKDQAADNREGKRGNTGSTKSSSKNNTGTPTGGGGKGGGADAGGKDSSGTGGGWGGSASGGGWCFDPNTFVQMADGSEKKIKEIQLGDKTKGGEVTGVFQFKAADEIHDYKGVTVAGSHFVKEDGRFIMVKDSPFAVKIDKIPVVYSLDTSGRRIFINDIEFADYNGDGIAKGFLSNAGVNLPGFDKEVLRQVENRLI